jgi:hypothetical protein
VTELAALPGAVSDLQRFEADFAQMLGATGLPYDQVLQGFTVANQWTTMRKASAAWDDYCQMQEGIAWTTLRAMMDRIKPVWEVAVASDPSLAATYPSLAVLFGAKKAIAQKAAATRRLNKAAIAKGEAPIHGVVGKKRQRRAAKAALAAAGAAGTSAPPAPAAPAESAGSTPQPAVQAPAPSATSPNAVAATAPNATPAHS